MYLSKLRHNLQSLIRENQVLSSRHLKVRIIHMTLTGNDNVCTSFVRLSISFI